MFGLAINLLGIKKAIGTAFTWATANVARMLAIALACSLVWGWWGWHGKAKVAKVLDSTVTGYRNAQAEATRAQAELNARHVATNEAVNKGSTDDHAKGLDAARAAVADYARLHPAPRCASSQAQPAAVPGDTGVAAGASGETGMVAVTVADLDTLTAGTVRGDSCRAWGQSLIDAGLAVRGD